MSKCLNCGFDPEAGLNKKQTSGMNNFVNKTSKLRVVMQRDEEEFQTGEGDLIQTWIRADVYDKQPKAVTQPILTQKLVEQPKGETVKAPTPVTQTANPA
jgi:hypothetical protein